MKSNIPADSKEWYCCDDDKTRISMPIINNIVNRNDLLFILSDPGLQLNNKVEIFESLGIFVLMIKVNQS